MITVSDIAQYLYCPKKIYFKNVLGYTFTKPKMDYARELHKHIKLSFPGCEIRYNVPLESEKIGVRGFADAIVKCEAYFPVEAKYTRFNQIYYSWKTQIATYAALLEEELGTVVKMGYIYLIEDKNLMRIEVTASDKKNLPNIVNNINRLIEEETIPKVGKSRKCNYCEMKKLC
jgi:CRISPR-associated exonuclease Cas4